MNLLRDGNVVDEATYIKTTDAINRAQGAADRIIMKTPDLNKCIFFNDSNNKSNFKT